MALNASHPQAAGCVFAMDPRDGSEAVSGAAGTSFGAEGVGFAFTGNERWPALYVRSQTTSGWRWTTPAAVKAITNSFTLTVIVDATDFPAWGSFFHCPKGNGLWANNYDVIGMTSNGSGVGSSSLSTSNAQASALNLFSSYRWGSTIFTLVVTPTGSQWYRNGAPFQSTIAGANAAVAWATNTYTVLGNRSSTDPGEGMVAAFSGLFIHSRALPASEVLNLANTWQNVFTVPIAPVAEAINTAWVLDTDFAGDYDDVLAVMCGINADRYWGTNLLAAVTSTSGTMSPGALDATLRYHGRPNVPIGCWKGAATTVGDTAIVQSIYNNFPSSIGLASTVPDAVAVLRQALVNSPSPVTYVLVGFAMNLAALLQSPADGISNLTGAQLVAQKVSKIYYQGGRFPGETGYGTASDYNSGSADAGSGTPNQAITSLQYAVANKPANVHWHWHSAIIGDNVAVARHARPGTPLAFAQNSGTVGYGQGRPGWDPLTRLLGLGGTRTRYMEVLGTCTVNASGYTAWTDNPTGTHHYYKQWCDTPALENYVEQLTVGYDEPLRPGQLRAGTPQGGTRLVGTTGL